MVALAVDLAEELRGLKRERNALILVILNKVKDLAQGIVLLAPLRRTEP